MLEIPVGVSGTALERIVVGKLTELRHAELARGRGDKPDAKSDLGAHGAGRALSPEDLAQVAELRLLRVRHDEQVARGAHGEQQIARLDAEIGELEARMGLGGDQPGAEARRHAVEVQAEVQNDGARRARVSAELEGTTGHPGVELHSHFFGVVEAEVFRQRAAATRGGDPGSWQPLLETIVGLEGPSFEHQMDGERIATRAVAGDAREIAIGAKKQVDVLATRAELSLIPHDKAAFLRGAEAVAQEACETALAATPETDFNSAYEVRDELVKQTFGGDAVPGDDRRRPQLRANGGSARDARLDARGGLAGRHQPGIRPRHPGVPLLIYTLLLRLVRAQKLAAQLTVANLGVKLIVGAEAARGPGHTMHEVEACGANHEAARNQGDAETRGGRHR